MTERHDNPFGHDISAGFTRLMEQAGLTAAVYLREATREIDEHLGEGYAKQHPELIAAFMQTAAIDMGAATLAKILQDGLGRLSAAL